MHWSERRTKCPLPSACASYIASSSVGDTISLGGRVDAKALQALLCTNDVKISSTWHVYYLSTPKFKEIIVVSLKLVLFFFPIAWYVEQSCGPLQSSGPFHSINRFVYHEMFVSWHCMFRFYIGRQFLLRIRGGGRTCSPYKGYISLYTGTFIWH